MPKITVKVNKQLVKAKFEKIRRQIKKKFMASAPKKLAEVMRKEIIDNHILKGKSPVKGEGRFDRYSESYKKQIRSKTGILKAIGKKVTPVNLKVSGQLISSFNIKKTEKGLKIGFKDKVSAYHQKGTDKMPRRQMLPGGGGLEKFKPAITRAYAKEAIKIMKNIVKIKNTKIKV